MSAGPTREDMEFFAEAAQKASRNAADLATEADLLLKAGHIARALALAIASLEEDGKHGAFVAQATDYDPTFRATLSNRKNITYKHEAKQGQAVQSLRNLFDPLPIDPPGQRR